MENSIHTKEDNQQVNQIRDAYNDEYWNKKYGVSTDELKSNDSVGISAKIIQVNKQKVH